MATSSKALGKFFHASYRRLLYTLEGTYENCDPELLEKILNSNFDSLLETLKIFKEPSEQSKKKIKEGNGSWKNEPKKLDEKQIKFILSLSEFLILNEEQTYELFFSFLITEPNLQEINYSDPLLLQNIADFYFEERLCLLRCIVSLFRNSNDESNKYYIVSNEFIERLIEKKLLDKMISLYSQLVSQGIPTKLDHPLHIKWVTQNILEQEKCLEIIFFIFYSKTTCEIEQFEELCKLFQSQGFGSRQNTSLTNEIGKKSLTQIGYLSILIVLEIFNLESLLLDIPINERNQFLFRSSNLIVIDKIFEKMENFPQVQPIFLTWAAILNLLDKLEDLQNLQLLNENLRKKSKTRIYGKKGLNGIGFLDNMVKYGFNENDPNLTGYKSVLKGVISVLFTSFQVTHLPQYNELVDLYSQIFLNQPALCDQFWNEDFSNIAQVSLLKTATLRFPYVEFLPLVKICNSLTSSSTSSDLVFLYLQRLVWFAIPSLLFLTSAISVDSSEKGFQIFTNHFKKMHWFVFRVTNPISLPDGLVLPSGMEGLYLQNIEDLGSHNLENFEQGLNSLTSHPYDLDNLNQFKVGFILFKFPYSGWVFFFHILENFVQRIIKLQTPSIEQIDQVTFTLSLISRILTFQPSLSSEFYTSETASSEFIRKLFLIVQYTSFMTNPPIELIKETISVINGFALTIPHIVWKEMKKLSLFEDYAKSVKSIGCMKHLLTNIECQKGEYSITLAFLDLLSTLLIFIKVYPIREENPQISMDEFLPYLNYLRTDIFSCFDSWRYIKLTQRWQIGYKVLFLFNEILYDTSFTSVSEMTDLNPSHFSSMNSSVVGSQLRKKLQKNIIQESLFESILFDSSFHHTLLNIIGIGMRPLERFIEKRVEEGQILEDLLILSLTILERVLLWKEDHITSNFNYKTSSSSLEQALFTRTIGKENNNFISLISSYLEYPYNFMIPFHSMRVLTTLCRVANQSGSQRITLIGFFNQIHRKEEFQRTILGKLSDKREREEMKIQIFHFLSQCLEFQPGMAPLFIRLWADQSNSDKITPDKKSSTFFLENVIITSFPFKSDAIQIVSEIIETSDYWNSPKYSPQFLCSLLFMLLTLWKVAPNYPKATESLLSPNCWKKLLLPLQDEDKEELEENQNLVYRILSRSWIVQFLSLEYFYVKELSSTEIEGQLKQCTFWLAQFNLKKIFNFELQAAFTNQADFLQIDLNGLLMPTQEERIYGIKKWHYNIELLEKKILPFKNGLDEFLALAKQVNLQFQILNSWMTFISSWKNFLTVILSRNLNKPNFAKEISDNLLQILIQLLQEFMEIDESIYYFSNQILHDLSEMLMVCSWYLHKQKGNKEVNISPQFFEKLYLLIHKKSSITTSLSYSNTTMIFHCLFTCLLNLLSISKQDNQTSKIHIILPHIGFFLEIPTLCNTCIALLNRIFQLFSDSNSVLSYYRSQEFLVKILKLFSKSLQNFEPSQNVESLKLTQSILSLFLSLAQHPFTAENLVLGGLVLIFNSDLFILHKDCFPYNQQNEPNIPHVTWCFVLKVVTALLKSCGQIEPILDQILQFTQIHFEFFLKAFQIPTTREKLTLGQLNELEELTKFIYELTYFTKGWKVNSSGLSQLHSFILKLIQYYAIILPQPTQIQLIAIPISKEERKWYTISSITGETISSAKTNLNKIPSHSNNLALTTTNEPKFKSEKSSTETSNQNLISENRFSREILRGICRVLQNSISIMSLLSPQFLESSEEIRNSQTFPSLFSPNMKTSIQEFPPSVGLLVSFLDHGQYILSKLTEEIANVKSRDASKQILEEEICVLLWFIMENITIIILQHLALFQLTNQISKESTNNWIELDPLENSLKRLKRNFPSIQQKLNNEALPKEKIKLFEIAETFINSFDKLKNS